MLVEQERAFKHNQLVTLHHHGNIANIVPRGNQIEYVSTREKRGNYILKQSDACDKCYYIEERFSGLYLYATEIGEAIVLGPAPGKKSGTNNAFTWRVDGHQGFCVIWNHDLGGAMNNMYDLASYMDQPL